MEVFMGFIKVLEGIRNPGLDIFFSLITKLGEEDIFIIISLFVFWCINKKKGFYLLVVGFAGTLANQFLKITFKIPRPWVKDPTFTIVESARESANGYSFPSGHTQTSVGVFGGLARAFKSNILRIICIALCVLIPLSRLYLGVHTLLDVSVSFILALIFIFVFYPFIEKNFDNKRKMNYLMIGMFVLCFLHLLYVTFYPGNTNIEASLYENAMKNAYKLMGCSIGVILAVIIDRKYIKFKTKAIWWVQLLKLVLGVVPILLIKSLLKQPLIDLCGNLYIANAIRYFLILFFACGIWPITFKYFSKIKKS